MGVPQIIQSSWMTTARLLWAICRHHRKCCTRRLLWPSAVVFFWVSGNGSKMVGNKTICNPITVQWFLNYPTVKLALMGREGHNGFVTPWFQYWLMWRLQWKASTIPIISILKCIWTYGCVWLILCMILLTIYCKFGFPITGPYTQNPWQQMNTCAGVTPFLTAQPRSFICLIYMSLIMSN